MCSGRAGRAGSAAAGQGEIRIPTRLGLRVLLGVAFLLSLCPAVPLLCQQTLEQSRRRLEEIRRERQQLEEERNRLQGQAHEIGQELDNLERQRQSTNRIVNELETQLSALNTTLDRASTDLALAQDNLQEKRAVLARRLAEIYKRGALYSFEVMVSAQSFGGLLNRYKYLHIQSRQDRSLVGDVERLAAQVDRRRQEILQVKTQVDQNRSEREAELQRYSRLVAERSRRLRETRRDAKTTEQRLSALQRDEARLNDLLAELERARRERPRGAPSAGAMTTADIGKLDWPVDGPIITRFGSEHLESGATIRHNGMYIGAPVGTPVRAVESGRVARAQDLGTYGTTMILEHGNGYWSIYARLSSLEVKPGDDVARGQVIGRVGGENTDEGPHLYFEIRGQDGIALDPADWLKRKR